MSTLTKADILTAEDLEPILVRTPEWGGDVYVLPCSGVDRDWFDQLTCDKRFPESGVPDWRGLRHALVARKLCDEKGAPMQFTAIEVEELGNKNGAALDRCYCAIRDASGMTGDADEDAEKN